jgi:hypothetical protein
MTHGKPIPLVEAQKNIRAFVNQERRRTWQNEQKIVVGQKLDLSVLKDFIKAIDEHDQHDQIDAVRIYFAKSNRGGTHKQASYDIVLVPVLKAIVGRPDRDLHAVYPGPDKTVADPTIIGNALPCPNVCPKNGKNISCGEGSNVSTKKRVVKKSKGRLRKK